MNDPTTDTREYDDMTRIVTFARIGQEIEAREAAAMLSMIDKARLAGDPCPGYAGMLEDLRAGTKG